MYIELSTRVYRDIWLQNTKNEVYFDTIMNETTLPHLGITLRAYDYNVEMFYFFFI